MSLLEVNRAGIYCPQGDFYIDPWRGVERAIITHAHSDHARRGSKYYLSHELTLPVLRHRLGKNIRAEGLEYGETVHLNGVRISLHPAAHIIGSAQVRVEYMGEVWVVTGDYKVNDDPLAGAFESLRCHSFLTESTFGLPLYRWPDTDGIIDEINDWWRINAGSSIPSVLFGYSLGKSQRILSAVDRSIGPVYVHPTIEDINRLYRQAGIAIPDVQILHQDVPFESLSNALILLPPGSNELGRLRSGYECSVGCASGWMAIRRRQNAYGIDRGFVLSDHADWPGLLQAVERSGAEQVFVTHGYTAELTRYLVDNGIHAAALETLFTGDEEEPEERE
jgi:putative mRNA 3-end processing factor